MSRLHSSKARPRPERTRSLPSAGSEWMDETEEGTIVFSEDSPGEIGASVRFVGLASEVPQELEDWSPERVEAEVALVDRTDAAACERALVLLCLHWSDRARELIDELAAEAPGSCRYMAEFARESHGHW